MDKILILDFGSQYTQLIARRIREQQVYCEIQPCTWTLAQIKEFGAKGIILSGGPASVLGKDAPQVDRALFSMDVPVLGVCYGMQLMAHALGGRVEPATSREYGRSLTARTGDESPLWKSLNVKWTSWMSHGDTIVETPADFIISAKTETGVIAAMRHNHERLYGLQFHPEVMHTENGTQILQNFIFEICHCRADWTAESYIDSQIATIRAKVGKERVLCALSGGVDSSVVAALLHKAIGEQLTCVFIDNGVLRLGEAKKVEEVFRGHFKVDLRVVDASERFLERLAGITDPEEKRKRIGAEFIAVFEEEAKKLGCFAFLAQGTLYPDVIESVSFKGPSVVIKSHHNVGGLPEKMGFKLIEPLRELFKDEVRDVGRLLGLPEEIIGRHPFPGPGLAIRIMGAVTKESLDILRLADAIVVDEFKKNGFYKKVWQAFAVLLPIFTVGVMGDERTYEKVAVLRVVDSQDGMTADWVDLPHAFLSKLSNRIINEVKGINRVVYDISSKPPATIEWE